MRVFLIAALVAGVLVAWLTYTSRNLPTALVIGQPVPHAALQLVGRPDSSVDVRALIDRPTIIDAMASWCGPCEQTVAPLERFVDSIGRDKLAILYVTYDGPRDTTAVAEFFTRSRLARRPTVYAADGEEFTQRYVAYGVPRSYLVDRSGALLWQGISSTQSPVGHALLDSAGLAAIHMALSR